MIISDPTPLISGGDTGTTFLAPIVINTALKTITITPGTGILPLTSDGITGQALFSALKLLWKNNSTYIKFPFPMEGVTPESFEFISGWTLSDLVTRKAIRTCGWVERNAAGATIAMWAGVISLGSIAATDQPYYQQTGATAVSVGFTFPGPVNEAVQVYSDPLGTGALTGGFDLRSYFSVFVREQQKIYASAVLGDIGVATMGTIAYRFPLANSSDLNILASDTAVVAGTLTYGGITVTYYNTNQPRTIGGTVYNYNVIIDGNGKTAEQIYTKVQYLLRQNLDMDAGLGVMIGKTAKSLLAFIGTTLQTTNGVYIDNFNANDTNRLQFTDLLGIPRQFPFVAAGSILFNSNLTNDTAAVYRMYFATNPLGDYGSANAVLVQDSLGNPISGLVAGSSSISFSFNYDSNVQGGRTPSVDVPVVLVAIGLTTGTYVSTTGRIIRGISQNFSLVSSIDRVYLNA